MSTNEIKLNQALAIEKGTQKSEFADLSKSHHILGKDQLFYGLRKTYEPNDEEGDKYPEETAQVQMNAKEIVARAQHDLAEMINWTATKDFGNCNAKADIVIEEGGNRTVLAEGVPTHHLLWLEKRLVDLRTFISKLPTLRLDKEWNFDDNANMYVSTPQKTIKTKQVKRSLTKFEPTEKHPGQADLVDETIQEGTWTTVAMSSAYPRQEIQKMLDRVTALERAVKVAREDANSILVSKKKIAGSLLGYIFEGTKPNK